MKRLVFFVCMLASPVFADERKEPTVTLTAAELQALIAAEVAMAQASTVIQKVKESLSRKDEMPPKKE